MTKGTTELLMLSKTMTAPLHHTDDKEVLPPIKVFAKAGLDNEPSAICKHQQ